MTSCSLISVRSSLLQQICYCRRKNINSVHDLIKEMDEACFNISLVCAKLIVEILECTWIGCFS